MTAQSLLYRTTVATALAWGIFHGALTQASPVLMDFEGLPATGTVPEVSAYDFNFDIGWAGGIGNFIGPPVTDPSNGVSLNGVANVGDPLFTMSHKGDYSFDLTAADLWFWNDATDTNISDNWVIRAYDEFDTLVNELNVYRPDNNNQWVNVQFDNSWNGINSVEFFGQESDIGFPTYIDNIAVNAIPVPAAVWLFSSGLAALGWVRRKPRI